jgi:hypothetical protein
VHPQRAKIAIRDLDMVWRERKAGQVGEPIIGRSQNA